MINLMNHDLPSLQAFCQSKQEPSFRATQIYKWIHQQGISDFQQMTNLSQSFRDDLSKTALVQALTVSREWVANDGTIKWLMACEDGNHIETVYMPSETRGTLCISSQIGCALQCDFCATGDQGFARNLTVAEIIGQLWVARQRIQDRDVPAISNVVMMGMGEPLLNYDAVVSAMRMMLDDDAYGLSKYKVTLSTSGIVPAMRRLIEDVPVALAVSLHAPTDALRDQLVPINKKYNLDELMAVCRDYIPGRHITFEYVMLEGVNDAREHAKALVRLLQGVSAKVNLIPYNHYEGGRYVRSSDDTIGAFQQYLMQAGLHTMVRRTRGDDVAGACGQLQGAFQDRTIRTAAGRAWQMRRKKQAKQKDIEKKGEQS